MDRLALDRAIDGFLDIPFHNQGWVPALEAFDAAIGALGTIILPAMKDKLPGPFPMSRSLIECTRAYIEGGWIQADVRERAIPAFLRRGIATNSDVIFPEQKRRSAYFHEFLHKHGADEWAGLRADISGDVCCVSIQRPLGSDPFTLDEINALVSVAPRFSMMASMLEQLDKARLSGLSDALETMTTPAFLLNRRSEVIRFNAAARTILNRDISIKSQRLEARGPDDRLFQKHLTDVLRQSPIASPASGAPFQIRRILGRPLSARVHRLRSDLTLAYFESAWGIVTITDPDRLLPEIEVLQSTLGLTEREAQIIRLLVQCNGSARIAADKAGITYETFRTHMRNVRNKTGFHSINELIKSILIFTTYI